MIDTFAGWVLLVLAGVIAVNWRQGTLGDWAKAKFLGAGDAPEPAEVDPTAAQQGQAQSAGLVAYNGTRMSPAFYHTWRPVVEAARAEGLNLVGGAYRSAAEQWQLRQQNCPDPVNSPASACSPPTAKVGSSRHETGDAIDIRGLRSYSDPRYVWLKRNAARFGIDDPVGGEPWHWERAR